MRLRAWCLAAFLSGLMLTGVCTSRADHLFGPPAELVAVWVNEGIEAAAKDKQVTEVPGFSRWIYLNEPTGWPFAPGRSVRFVIVVSPRFVATLAGWKAAWDEATWRRIQEDREAVVREMAGQIALHFQVSSLTVAVGLEDWGGPTAAKGRTDIYVYGGERWYDLRQVGERPLLEMARLEPLRNATIEWALTYTLGGLVDADMLDRPKAIRVKTGILETYSSPPTNRLFDLVPSMHYFQPGDARLVVGDVNHFGFLDLNLKP
jgi:hypothetical protein